MQAGCAAAERVVALVSTGENATALEYGVPWWERLDDVPGAEPALNQLARNLASASLSLGDVAAQRRFIERRMEIARSLGDRRALASASIQLGVHFNHVGEPDRARTLLEHGADLARDVDVPDALCYALLGLGSSGKGRDLPTALQHARDACVVARRTGKPMYRDYASANLTMALWVSGLLDEARIQLDELAITVAEPVVRAWVPALDLWLCGADGREPLPSAPLGESDSETVLGWTGAAETEQAVRRGDLTTAARRAEAALGHVVDAMGLDDDFVVLWPPLVRAVVAAGDLPRARRMLAPVADARQESVVPVVDAHWHALRGLVESVDGSSDVVVEGDLRRGAESLERLGARGEAARSREDLARWLHARSRLDEARDLLGSATATYRSIGASAWAARAGSWAQAHDLPLP